MQGTVIGWTLNTAGDDCTLGIIWMAISGERLNKWTVILIAVASEDKKRSPGQSPFT